MTTAAVNIVGDQDTTANLRLAGAAINAQLAAMGLVQTSDTGQINWTTINRQASGSSLIGYEIWRFNDALQSTVPVFIRLEYWTVSTANHYGTKLRVGFATDGAGNIGGAQQVGPLSCVSGASIVSTLVGAIACHFSGAAGRIAMSLFTNNATDANLHQFISIERSKDGSGADDGSGVIILMASGGASTVHGVNPHFSQYLPFTGGVPSLQEKWPAILSNGPSAFGATVHMGVPIPLAGDIKNPGLGALVYNTNDFTPLTDHTITLYGSGHVYKTLGENAQYVVGCGMAPSGSTTDTAGFQSRIAMRWE